MTGKLISALRDKLPSSYVMRVNAFQSLLDAQIEKYESGPFEVGGVTWRLNLYPNGRTVANYIALTLESIHTDKLKQNWQVNVSLKFFVLDQKENKYRVFQEEDGSLKTFHATQTELGFDELMSVTDFKDAANAYLVRDSCSFGVEVSVVEYTGKGEHMSIVDTPETMYSVEVPNFTSLDENKLYHSADFELGDQKWNVSLYPKGSKADKFKNISLFLNLSPSKSDISKLPIGRKVYVAYTLRIVDAYETSPSLEKEGTFWFSEADPTRGFSNFASINSIFKRGTGYVANNTLTVEVEFKQMTRFEYYA